VKISPKTRRILLLLALPLAAFAAFQAQEGEGPQREARTPAPAGFRASAGATAPDPLPRLEVRRLENLARRHASEQSPVDPFAVPGAKERAAAEAAAAAAPPPPPPQAPPLPFRYIGRQEAGSVQTIFLEQEEQVHIVRIGEKIGDGWRLDAAGEDALTFTYLPLGQQRRLPLGSAG